MELRYIGEDGLYGLAKGQTYNIDLFVKNNYIWVRVKVEYKSFTIPYTTPVAFANNWEVIR